MMPRIEILKGSKWGLLTAIRSYGVVGNANRAWQCRCDCGTVVRVSASALSRGKKKSCGCLKASSARARNLKHGMEGTPTYNTWAAMLQRCHNTRSSAYKLYGALGVSVCSRWATFNNFLLDMGIRPEGQTLDRINPFGNYEPENCRWATKSQQATNTRRHFFSTTWRLDHDGFVGPK